MEQKFGLRTWKSLKNYFYNHYLYIKSPITLLLWLAMYSATFNAALL